MVADHAAKVAVPALLTSASTEKRSKNQKQMHTDRWRSDVPRNVTFLRATPAGNVQPRAV